MSTESRDQEIIAMLAEKMHIEPRDTEYDDFGNLIKLNLSEHNLTFVPSEVLQLRGLQDLSLAGNQLKQLPLEIGEMNKLQRLDVDRNPHLTLPPSEILEQGTTAILDFLRELQRGSVCRYEAKLLLVGEPRVGKTSLLKALRGEDLVPEPQATDGIEIGRYQLAYPNKPGSTIILHTWDFEGEEISHATHQFFMTKRSLYLLVWNALTESRVSRLEYWLDIIVSLAPDSHIVLAATQIDLFPVRMDYRYYRERYPQIVDCVEVSSSTRNGISKLKEILAAVAVNLPGMGQLWPQAWQDLEEALLERQEPYLERSAYLSFCTSYRVSKEVACGTLGNYLHDLGKIQFFQDDYVLCSFVILKPTWITKAISRVLRDGTVRERKGLLLRNDWDRIWREDEKEQYYKPHIYLVFIKLMERFHLSYQLENSEHALQSLIPLLLPYDPPPDLEQWSISTKEEQTEIKLVYDFGGKEVPVGTISRFIVSTQSYSQECYWKYGVVLASKEQQAKVEISSSLSQLYLNVKGNQPANFFYTLMTHIDAILADITYLPVQRMVPCICHHKIGRKETCDYLYRLNDLKRRLQDKRLPEVDCLRSDEKIKVRELLVGIIQYSEDVSVKLDNQDQKAERQQEVLAVTVTPQQHTTVAEKERTTTEQTTEMTSFVLQLRQKKDQHFEVQIHSSLGGELPAIIVPLPFTSNELITILKALKPPIDDEPHFTTEQIEVLQKLELWDRELAKTVPDLKEEIGKRLYRVLIVGEIRNLFYLALQQGRILRKTVPLQIRFYEQDVELASYPWELLHDSRRFLVRSNAVELTRYISYPEAVNTLPFISPQRLLYIQSRPTNLGNLPTKEQKSLRQALESLIDKGLLKIDVLEPPTYENLVTFLEKKDYRIHIIHFDGHGVFAKQCPNCNGMNYPHYEYCQVEIGGKRCNTQISRISPKGYLALEDAQQHKDWIDSSILGDLLYNHQVYLVVLSACRSSGVGGETLFSGNAPALIQAGVSAVVSVQLPVSVDAANTFTLNFYDKLAQGELIPAAVSTGRRFILRTGEWFIPTLYLRNGDNKRNVFTLEKENQ